MIGGWWKPIKRGNMTQRTGDLGCRLQTRQFQYRKSAYVRRRCQNSQLLSILYHRIPFHPNLGAPAMPEIALAAAFKNPPLCPVVPNHDQYTACSARIRRVT